MNAKRALQLWPMMVLCSSYAYLNEPRISLNTRYFTYETVLPPLPCAEAYASNDTLTIPYASSRGRSLPVVYTNDPATISDWLSENLPREHGGILGFDTESLPRLRRKQSKSSFENAATVQLATTDSCLVVHLVRGRSGQHSHACSPVLKSVLDDKQYVKAGCGIDEDMMDLYNLWGDLDAKSRLDLGAIGRERNERLGLKALTAQVVGVDLPKSKSLTLSDWTAVPLTEPQIAYSARDAWAGAAIARKLAQEKPDVFGLESLISSLETEVPIPYLVERQQLRENAKLQLVELLRPFKRTSRHRLPRNVKRKARRLREAIRAPVMEPSVFVGEDPDLNF
eukprot:scaffold26800_cov127-Cylindrotheca_fusiformis.AAC.1